MSSSKILYIALRANAVFSLINGLILTLFPFQVALWIGYSSPLLYQIIGVGLVLFGLHLIFLSCKKNMPKLEVYLVSFGDFAWVLATAVLLLLKANLFSQSGIYILTGIGLVVLIFGLLQLKGLYNLLGQKS